MAAVSFQESLRQLSFTIRDWLNKNAIINKSVLRNNTDLNTVLQAGFYFLNNYDNYYNQPVAATENGALVLVLSDSTGESASLYQVYLDRKTLLLYVRSKDLSNEFNEFSNWRVIIQGGSEGENLGIELSKIASSGSIYDIIEGSQTSTGETDVNKKYLIFNCGTATSVI